MKKAFLKYIMAVLLFGTNGIVAGKIELESHSIVLLRTALGGIMLLLVTVFSKHGLSFWHHQKDLLFISLSGAAMGASWLFLYAAYDLSGVGVASLLYAAGAVIVMLFSPFVFKESMTVLKLVGLSAAVIGIIFINLNEIGNHTAMSGIMCGLFSAVCYALMVILNKKATNINGTENSAFQLITAFAVTAVFNCVRGGIGVAVKADDIFWILLLGIVNTGIGCWMYFSSLGALPAQTVSVFGYIEPLSAIVFSALLLGEKLRALQIVGAVLIIGGAMFAECSVYLKKPLHR